MTRIWLLSGLALAICGGCGDDSNTGAQSQEELEGAGEGGSAAAGSNAGGEGGSAAEAPGGGAAATAGTTGSGTGGGEAGQAGSAGMDSSGGQGNDQAGQGAEGGQGTDAGQGGAAQGTDAGQAEAGQGTDAGPGGDACDLECEAGQHCAMVEVQCIRAPCPPLPMCVSDETAGDGESCGGTVCGAGMVCCNRSCGICAPPDGACTQQFCG